MAPCLYGADRKGRAMNLFESTANSPDNLIASYSDVIAVEGIVLTGEGILPRGAVLGKITVGGKYALVNTAGTDDGRRTAAVVLAEDVDATNDDVVCSVYIRGEFNDNALLFGGTDTAATHKATLQGLGIVLRGAVEVN
ncbi:head decoration protein [bacterium]|nr:head decoration protein [bacterium]